MSTSPLDTYRSGQHEAAWDELAAQPGHPDAQVLARETMKRLADAVRMLERELPARGWVFDEPEGVLPGVDAGAATALHRFEVEVGPLPLALRALALHVGPVDFTGHHPDWDVEHPDPVVLLPFWAELLEEHAAHVAWGTFREPGSDGTFPMPLAPDAFHKAGVSGGPPYAVALPDARVDPPWLEDPTHAGSSLLGYLRSAVLDHAGLPGFAAGPRVSPPAELRDLATRLPRF